MTQKGAIRVRCSMTLTFPCPIRDASSDNLYHTNTLFVPALTKYIMRDVIFYT